MDLNIIKIAADVFDWTIERAAQSIQTFLDGNYYIVAYLINICLTILKSIAETISFSGYVLRCYYLDFLAFLSELNTGVSFVFSLIYGFCSRLVLSVLTGLGCVGNVIVSLYLRIVFGFHLIRYYLCLCVEEFIYFLNVCFAAVLLILQLGPNFLIFLWNTLLYCVTTTNNYICFTGLCLSNFSASICEKWINFILTIPPKAYIGLLLLVLIFYGRATILKYSRFVLRSIAFIAVKIIVQLGTAVKFIISLFANIVLKRRANTRSEGTLNLIHKSVFKRYFSILVPFLTFSIFRTEQNEALDLADKGKFMCVVCQDKEKNVLLIPCRHLCMCEECTATVLRSYLGCPLCRKQILDTVRVYT